MYGVQKIKLLRFDYKHIISFGLGWGFIEALLLYAISIIYSVYFIGSEILFLDALPGAIERNSAIIFHIAASFISYKALISSVPFRIGFISIGIILHTTINYFASFLIYVLNYSIWSIEIALFAFSILILIFGYSIAQKN
jgi:hypothetical protein